VKILGIFPDRETRARLAIVSLKTAIEAVAPQDSSIAWPGIAMRTTEAFRLYLRAVQECGKYVNTRAVSDFRQDLPAVHWILPLRATDRAEQTGRLLRLAQEEFDQWTVYAPITNDSLLEIWNRSWQATLDSLRHASLLDEDDHLHYDLAVDIMAVAQAAAHALQDYGNMRVRSESAVHLSSTVVRAGLRVLTSQGNHNNLDCPPGFEFKERPSSSVWKRILEDLLNLRS
jgi:hypothetical protein